MQLSHRMIITGMPAVALAAGFAGPAAAQTMDVTVEIPRLSVAEYHRPYVAIWLEKPGTPAARSLSVWYDFDKKNNEGTKWLRDVRQWWRVSGRTLQFPVDGVTGATRAPGANKVSYTAGKGVLGNLSGGDYVLVVEAAREVGGRELVRLPFSWPPKPGQIVRAAGKSELGGISIAFRK